jgi:hypothetical protein
LCEFLALANVIGTSTVMVVLSQTKISWLATVKVKFLQSLIGRYTARIHGEI